MAEIDPTATHDEPIIVTGTNPAPLALSALALTTFVFSAANAQLFTGTAIIIGLALFYGGLTQLLAGLGELRAGNTFNGTAFASYGGFWLAYGFAVQYKLIPNDTALAYFWLGWTIFTAILLVGSLRTAGTLIGLFFFFFLTFLFLTIGAFWAGSTFNVIGGWLGIVTAIIAWYSAFAGLLKATKSPFVLPIWPRS